MSIEHGKIIEETRIGPDGVEREYYGYPLVVDPTGEYEMYMPLQFNGGKTVVQVHIYANPDGVRQAVAHGTSSEFKGKYVVGPAITEKDAVTISKEFRRSGLVSNEVYFLGFLPIFAIEETLIELGIISGKDSR